MVKTTAMLLEQYSSYMNPAAKIGRMVRDGDLVPVITVVASGMNVYGQCDVKGWKNMMLPQK